MPRAGFPHRRDGRLAPRPSGRGAASGPRAAAAARAGGRRAGMAVLLMLLLLSLTLGLSYALVRSQNMSSRIERNLSRRDSARQAALTGVMVGLKKMQTAGWAGVNTTLVGQLSRWDGYSVAYTAGDPALTSTSSDYADYPFRVTLLSTGTAVDPADPTCISTHQVQAVVRLIPRKLAAEPTEWADIQNYTLYQYKSGTLAVSLPFRLQGTVRCADDLRLTRDYGWSDTARQRYLTDLNTMRGAGYADCRPLTGIVHLPYSRQEAGLVTTILSGALGLTTVDKPRITSSSLDFAVSGNTYRLYTGGPTYNVGTVNLSSQLEYQADPVNNPLGIFVHAGTCFAPDSLRIQGTLILRSGGAYGGSGSLHFTGRNNRLTAVSLPALHGSSAPVQLPAAVVRNDCRVWPGAGVTLQGMVTVTDEFEIYGDDQSHIQFAVQGALVANDVRIDGRDEWGQPASWWSNRWNEFLNQGSNPITLFPVWLQARYGLRYGPAMSIGPQSPAPRYHWNNLQNPIFVADPADGGLRWDLLRLTEVE